MDSAGYGRVVDLFERLRELPEADALAALAAETPETREEVRRMLDADREGNGEFLSGHAMKDAAALFGEPDPLHETSAGGFAGRYQLVEQIGAGGMGEVWLAEQRVPVRRRVALKMIRAGMNTREVIARFESERQVIALMDHPAIAKVLDAGATPEGLPYFVMEFVEGLPLTAYCDQHKLPVVERLRLFQRVCHGVQHAHQKGVIHRDLKPSNILVAQVEAQPYPKIIDFGVAKALHPTGEHEKTMAGNILGTPSYMSPEQAGRNAHDIDSRSDVYSLGAVLYELLCGVTPMETAGRNLLELLDDLLHTAPPRPSARLSSLDAAKRGQAAAVRGVSAEELAKTLRGDLDAIVTKAIEKDRNQRYGSPHELAADIERYLKQEPVLATPPTTLYLTLKFVGRHRLALATLLAFMLVLVAATAISIRERVRADAEAATAQAVSDFLRNDLLAQASTTTQVQSRAKPDLGLTVRQALDRAAERIGDRFAQRPAVEAKVRETIGQTYEDLGLYDEAYGQFRRVLELHRGSLGIANPDGIRALNHVAQIWLLQGKYQDAAVMRREALEQSRRVLGPDHPQTLRAMNGLAANYGMQSRLDLAGPLFQEAYQRQLRVQGPEHPDTLITLNNLATVLMRESKHREATALFQKMLEIRLRVLGPDHPQTLVTLSHLAETLMGEGRYAEAEAAESRALEARRRVLGANNSFTLLSMANLGAIYRRQGKLAAAEQILSETLRLQLQTIGTNHVETLQTASLLGDVYNRQHRYRESEALLQQPVQTSSNLRGKEDPVTLELLTRFAVSLAGQGRISEAETLLSQNLETARRVLGSSHDNTQEALSALERVRAGQQSKQTPGK